MPTAFVTGGSGFIGGALSERLPAEGWSVRALARSDRSAQIVRARGAEAVWGDPDDVEAMTEGARGADVALNAAAHLGEWGARWSSSAATSRAPAKALAAARAAGVRRLRPRGHRGRADAREPLVNADERVPLRPDSKALYSATKAQAEPGGVHFVTDLTRLALCLASQECTIDISRARSELGYAPVKTIDEGMEELRRAHIGGV